MTNLARSRPVSPGRSLACVVLPAAVLGGGCYAEPLEEFEVPVLAVVEGDTLRLQAGDVELDGDPEPLTGADLPRAESVLGWELRDRSGHVVRSGVVPDTRALRSEWDEGQGEMTGVRDVRDSGAVGVWLPNTSGEIRVFADGKMDGQPLATTSYQPRGGEEDGIGELTQSLLSVSDLRRSPQRLWGSAARDEAINILFVPEGFRSSELDAFREAALETVEDMFAAKPAFERHDDRIGAWYIDIPSVQSGVSIPGEGVRRTTAFETKVSDRDVLSLSLRGGAAATYLRTRWGMDVVVVLANTEAHRGSALGKLITMPNAPRRAHTFAHELGHALYGLADEYTEPSACTFTRRLFHRGSPNVDNTADRSGVKWSHLIDEGTPLPTDDSSHPGAVGAFEGAGYCESGWFRPQHTCLMRSSRDTPCAVCAAEMARVMRNL